MSREETVIKHHLVSDHSEQKKAAHSLLSMWLNKRFHLHLFNSVQTGRRNGVLVRATKAYKGLEVELLLLLNLVPFGDG